MKISYNVELERVVFELIRNEDYCICYYIVDSINYPTLMTKCSKLSDLVEPTEEQLDVFRNDLVRLLGMLKGIGLVLELDIEYKRCSS